VSEDSSESLTLRVAKAIPSDVGHGRARVPFDNELNLKPGDIVEIAGEQSTAAIVWRCRPEDANLGVIRIDGIIRKNAGVSLGDRVTITKVETQPCERLVLSPVMAKQQKVRFGPGIEGFARRGLNKRPVVAGDRIFIPGMTLFAEALPFAIVSTNPKGIVQVLPDTEIIIKEDAVDEEETGQIQTISYEDIGGIGEQLQKVREMIELPLKHPILFRRLGIDPPRGVLLHGPPGTGKTLIAKAVASETKAHFTSINGPEIISKYYGESEKQLREIFDEAAANAPAIIFIDELDSIAPKREDVTGEVERRVVAQLLTLLDGMEGRDNVVVIGATNRRDAIDPALRRPGRFDRELEIGVPDKNGREEIINIHTRGMPISDDFDIDWLLDNSYGFVGADISALVRESAMKALRRYLPEIDLDEEHIPPEVLEKMEVTMSDFRQAIKEIEPSALREIYLEVPEVSWDEVGGLEEVKERLKESIEWPLTKPELFEHFGINPPRGILLFGAPGTGKTLIAHGSEFLKEEFLPKILTNEVEFAVGYSEPEAGSDAAAMKLKATETEGGWILNGQKTWTTSAHFAEWYWVGARTDPDAPKHFGITLFLVPMDHPGITVQGIWTMGDERTNDVFFDDVFVPEEYVVGQLNHGFQYISQALDLERFTMFTFSPVKQRLDLLLDHVRTTTRDGQPLREDPRVRSRIARLATTAAVAHGMGLRVVDASMKAEAGGGAPPTIEASEYKLFTTEFSKVLADASMDLGGPGTQLRVGTVEAPMVGRAESTYRYTVLDTIGGGTSEVQKNIISRRGLGLPKNF